MLRVSSTKTGKLTVMHKCVKGIEFACFCDFPNKFGIVQTLSVVFLFYFSFYSCYIKNYSGGVVVIV